MKKIFSIVAAAVMLVSCNGKAQMSETLSDTISVRMGEMYGYGVADQMKNGPDSAKFDAHEFIKGLESVISMDTAEVNRMNGIAMGLNLLQMQKQAKNQFVDMNKELLVEAFKKAFLSDSTVNMQELQMEVMTLMQRATNEGKRNDPKAKKNAEDGAAYAAAKVEEGYQKTESGLVYKVIAEGKGEVFAENDNIEVKYEGKLIDGTVFDATQGDETRTMRPTQVVPGFKEALMMMKPGAKMEVVIPGDLAYGIDGRGGLIGPNATLVFTLETIGVKK